VRTCAPEQNVPPGRALHRRRAVLAINGPREHDPLARRVERETYEGANGPPNPSRNPSYQTAEKQLFGNFRSSSYLFESTVYRADGRQMPVTPQPSHAAGTSRLSRTRLEAATTM
jgi:hypothetical protein